MQMNKLNFMNKELLCNNKEFLIEMLNKQLQICMVVMENKRDKFNHNNSFNNKNNNNLKQQLSTDIGDSSDF